MIWKKKVFEHRSPMEWLDADSGFTIGIKRLVQKMGRKPLPEWFLEGHLIRIRKGKDAEEKIAGVVASLLDHAELAVYLTASQALTMHLGNQDHPSTDLSIAVTFMTADLLVITGLEGMTKDTKNILDGLISTRAGQPPKLTVITEPVKVRVALPISEAEFGERITSL